MRTTTLFWLVALVLTGCAKDVNEFIAAPGTDTSWVQAVQPGAPVLALTDSLQIPFNQDSIDLTLTDSVESYPILLTFPGSWTNAGAAYSGGALLQTLYLQTVGNFIRNGISTQFAQTVYAAGGVLYVGLQGPAGALEPTGGFSTSIQGDDLKGDTALLIGSSSPSGVEWTDDDADSTPGQNRVTFTYDSTGWFLYGTPITTSGPLGGGITLVMPNQFTNVNTLVYVVFGGYAADVRLVGNYDFKTFSATGLPVVNAATLVSISLIGGTYYLGVRQFSMAAGAIATTLNPAQSTLASILSTLAQL